MRLLPLLMITLTLLSGCTARSPAPKESPAPSAVGEVPLLRVWVVEDDVLVSMDAETYVAGVVAGEIPSDWPSEALKAQAILARTFVMKFLSEKESRYPGADISTDIAEAQAYDADAVTPSILRAVQETRGLILVTEGGQLPYTWFHAHSGGSTALARESLDWKGDEPAYTRVVPGHDSSTAPDSAKAWTAAFTTDEFISACRDTGADVSTCGNVVVSETGPSGRAVTISVDGVPVNASRLRISLGSTRMRSTLLTALDVQDAVVHMAGRGYGHGVGMPQWGAYALAEEGWSAEEIALHYYNELQLIRAW